MLTLYDLGQEVIRIRKAINDIEIKGEHNASLIVYGVKKCDDIIRAINQAAEEKEGVKNEQHSDESE